MRLRAGLLRALVAEALSWTHTGVRAAPTDRDTGVEGHLPEELPPSASLDDGDVERLGEEAWVPNRWIPGEGDCVDDEDLERMGSPSGMDEVDARIEGDNEDEGMSKHLRDDVSLGEPGEHDL